MTLSVIIPAYNKPSELIDCINTLGATGVLANELIVNDDASPDFDLRKFVGTFCERNPHNLGFAGNVNQAAKRASRDILAIINQDVSATPERSQGWDAALVNAFADPQVGIVGARLLFPNGAIQSAGGLFDVTGSPYHRCLGYSNPDYEEVATAREVDWVTGATLAIRRELFERVGGFDTSYVKGYWEDVDLCMKVRALGFKVWYEPRATLIHSVGSTGGNPYFHQNARLFRERWVDTNKVPRQSAYFSPERFW